MKQYLINFVKFSLFLGVGLAILYWVYLKQDAAYQEDCVLKNIPAADCSLLQKIFDDFKSADYFWVGIVLLCFTVSNISRAMRWRMLLKSMGYSTRISNAFLTVMLGYFANLGLPRMGEVLRAATMGQYEKIPLEKVVGTVVVGRIVDVICLLGVIGLAFLIEFEILYSYIEKYAQFDGFINLAIMGSSILIAILVLGFIFRKQIVKTPVFQKIKKIFLGFWEGILTVANLERPWIFILHSLNIWLMYFLMVYFCFFSFAPTAHLGMGAALMAFVMGAIAITIPSPGGMGTYHFLVTNLLVLYGIKDADAFSFANILFFSVQIGINVFLGLIALVALPILNREYEPAPPPAP